MTTIYVNDFNTEKSYIKQKILTTIVRTFLKVNIDKR